MTPMKCVWMTSGLVAYKLCSHYYRCDTCIFDRVMRGGEDSGDILFPGTAEPAEIHRQDGSQAPGINGALFYHRNHCWAMVENIETVRIGIDGLLSWLIAGIKSIILPRTGEKVAKGEPFVYIIHRKYILELISPLSGIISAVNYSLQEKPDILASDCWGAGWVVKIRPGSLEQDMSSLIFGKKAVLWYEKKERRLKETCVAYLNQDRGELGMTLQDGGERIANLADALTAEQYYQVLDILCQEDEAM